MEDYLYYRDLFEPILGDKGRPTNMSDEKWVVLHKKTVSNIRKWIDQNIFQHFSNDTRADVFWKKFESVYERKIGLNKANCLKQITQMRYKNEEDMTKHVSNFQ